MELVDPNVIGNEEAKKEEIELAKKLESSDPILAEKKKELAKKLEQIAKESENLAKNQIEQTEERSKDLLSSEMSEKIKDAKENLEEVAGETKDTAKPANTVQALKNDAKELAQVLNDRETMLSLTKTGVIRYCSG